MRLKVSQNLVNSVCNKVLAITSKSCNLIKNTINVTYCAIVSAKVRRFQHVSQLHTACSQCLRFHVLRMILVFICTLGTIVTLQYHHYFGFITENTVVSIALTYSVNAACFSFMLLLLLLRCFLSP
jgi:hypothetical protein